MSRSSPSRPLSDISQPVLASSLALRPGPLGYFFRWLDDVYISVLSVVCLAAHLVLLFWLPAAFLGARVVQARLLATGFLYAVFALCIGYHFLRLVMAVPWRNRTFPVLLDRSAVYYLLVWRHAGGFALAPLSAGLAAIMWLQYFAGWQAAGGAANTLVHALANSILCTLAITYGSHPPYYVFRKPTAADLGWMRCHGLAGASRAQLPVQPVAPVQSVRPVQPVRPPAAQPQANAEYATPVLARQARMKFADICGMVAVKERLLAPAQAILATRTEGSEPPGNGILMHGAPGNGKSSFAEALAGELRVPIVTLTYGEVSSKWVGEMPRLVKNCFEYAKAHAPCLLFVDEVDSFLRSRDSASNNSEDLKITNTLLTELVDIRRHPVVVVAATNYVNNLDAAAIREGRFDFKVEITPPDETARIGLLQKAVSTYAPALEIDPGALLSVAKRWNGFSVSRLLAVGKELPNYAHEHSVSRIGFDEWMAVLRLVQGRKGRPPADTKPLKDLMFEPTTREALELVSARLKDAHQIEEMGGTLPSGILFHGPSGTGKTAAACALALDCGWALLSVAGPDLLADREMITKIYAQAADLRPTLIFVDEADDVLRNRQFTTAPDLVNRLLTLMDGTGEKVRDVVFIAATNNPEMIDPALIRAGRFTEKIEFFLPSEVQIARAVRTWLRGKKVSLESGSDTSELIDLLKGQSVANVEGVLQYALNRAILRTNRGHRPRLLREDLQAGMRVIASGHA